MTQRIHIFSMLFIVIMIAVAIPSGAGAYDPSDIRHLVLQSASEMDYPPFALVRPDGSADGFSVDLLKAVAKAVGLNLHIAVGPWHEIKQKLADGDLDVLPLVSYSGQRDQVYDFTAPYLRMHGTIFVRKGNQSIRSKADLKDKEVMVMRGDTAHEYAVRENLSEKLILTDNFEQAMTQLSQGKNDAVLIQHLVGLELVKKLGLSNVVSVDTFKETDLKPMDRPLSGFEQKFCIAVKDGDRELLALLNEGLAIVIASGTYDALYNKWFGPILPQPPVPFSLILKYLFFILVPVLLILSMAGLWFLKREVARKAQSLRSEISEREKIETALRESEGKFQIIFDTVHSGVMLISQKGEITLVNRRMADMLGCDSHEIIGTDYIDYIDYIDAAQSAEARKELNQLIDGRLETVSLERRYKRKDGTIFWGYLAVNRLYHPDSSFWCLVVVIYDITKQKKLAQQLLQSHKMEAIGTLAGGIAHNFNNILSSIMGFTELSLIEVEPGSILEDNLREVFKASKRARDLVKQMLSYSRQSNEDIAPVRVGEVVEKVMKFIKSSVPSTIDIKSDIQSDSLIMGETIQIHQILINLYTNAAYAMGDSGGSLTVTLSDVALDETLLAANKELKPGDYVKLSVSDTGTGIAPEVLGLIFDPYFTTKETDKGTGMGLAMVHGIVESYGGKISVDTQIGRGTTFTILLPIITADF